MAVRTQCPRCKQPLSVPNKLTGSYASCPRCQGRFWVSKDAPLDPSVSDSDALPLPGGLTLTPAPVATPPIAAPPGRPVPSPASSRSRPAGVPRPAASPAAAILSLGYAVDHGCAAVPAGRSCACSRSPLDGAPADGPPTGPPIAPPQARKVARLVSAEAAQSTLKLAADGQLPQLQLQESDKKDKGQNKSRSIPPLVMILAWILSVAFTIAIVMITNGGGDSDVTTPKRKKPSRLSRKSFSATPRGVNCFLISGCSAMLARPVPAGTSRPNGYTTRRSSICCTRSRGASRRGRRRSNRLQKGITGSRDHDRELEQLILTVLGE